MVSAGPKSVFESPKASTVMNLSSIIVDNKLFMLADKYVATSFPHECCVFFIKLARLLLKIMPSWQTSQSLTSLTETPSTFPQVGNGTGRLDLAFDPPATTPPKSALPSRPLQPPDSVSSSAGRPLNYGQPTPSTGADWSAMSSWMAETLPPTFFFTELKPLFS